jgi:uncharacterized protein (DUF2147 family)
MKKLFLLVACMTLLLVANVFAQDADAILGEWYTKDSKALVEIYKCNDRYCGKIVWLKEPLEEDGSEKLDTNNPDESKRADKIIGLNLVGNFIFKGKNKWADGTIYDPDNGKTYSCKMALKGDELKVRGFIGISLIGRTQVWNKKS